MSTKIWGIGGRRAALGGLAVGVVLVGVLTRGVGCRPTPAAPPFRMRTLARLPADTRTTRLITSDDGSRQARVETGPDGRCRVVDTGSPQGWYRECGRRVLAFSRGAGRLFYDAVDAADRPWLVIEGVPVAIEPRPDGLAWSRSGGRRWAATGRAADGGGSGREVVLAVDGTLEGPWADASRPVVSDDDTQVAVVAQRSDASLALLVNGAERRRYPPAATACGMPPPPASQLDRHVQLRYLGDGRLLQVVPDDDGWSVYRDDERLASYPVHVPVAVSALESRAPAAECERQAGIQVGSATVAERAPVAAWWERLAEEPAAAGLRWRVSRDGTPASSVTCRWPAAAGDEIAITPDGRHVGFACAVGSAGPAAEVYAVLDDRRFGPYRQVWGVAISSDGNHLAYTAAGGGGEAPWRVYRDGVPLSRRFLSIWPPRFSPDGHHVAWEALIDREGRGVVGVDGDALALFSGVLSGPLFPAPGRAAWVILRGRRIVQLDVDLR